jgi:hypothetical protein
MTLREAWTRFVAAAARPTASRTLIAGAGTGQMVTELAGT